MAKKEPLKKATLLPGGGRRWAWDGTGGIRHTVDYDGKSGSTVWTVWHGDLPMRCEQPWFLVRSLGEVQENIKYFRNADLDKIHANRAMLACGLHPDQHSPMSYCNCGPCQGIPAF